MGQAREVVVEALRDLLGKKGVRIQEDDFLPDVIVKPESTEQVSKVLRICNDAGQAVVPIGGRTGLVNGLWQTDGEIGLSLERMNAVEEIDSVNRTMTVQAGCILQVALEAAEDENLLLPLDLGARGSATVGGNVATNAGGNMVIRYGMVRDMILGLEVVLADGTVLSNLNKTLKNNTGYDLKQLFIGAEGTLGVVTRVVFRLRPLPVSQNTALLAVDGFSALEQLLRWMDTHTAGTLSAFEVMWPEFYSYVTRDGSNHRPPLPAGDSFYVLVETRGSDPVADAERFEGVLGEAMEAGLVADAVLTRSQAERNALWEIRDDVLDFFNLGPFIPFDISVTLDRLESFVAMVRSRAEAIDEPICILFGHLGDCNLHVLLGSRRSEAFDPAQIEEIVYGAVEHFGGSVSAEHGVGLAKRSQLHRSRSEAELRVMMSMKHWLDPKNILNPNKIFAATEIAAQ